MFYFAYTRDDQANNANWPITFLYNGGPGSSSSWIHLGGNGPKRFNFGDEGYTIGSSALEDNAYTLLTDSDIVFIDPINTGYSRVAAGVPTTTYDGLQQDAGSIGDFMKLYLTTNNRMGSPKFIVGESYGGMRSPVLARYLDEQLHIKLDGVVLISPWLDGIGDMIFNSAGQPADPADDVPYVDYLPEYATIAWYHKKLSSSMQSKTAEEVYEEALKYARTDYLDALTLGDELPASTQSKVLKKLEEFTGLSPAELQTTGIRVGLDYFRTELLKDQGLVFGYYDGRMTAKLADPTTQDPSDAFNPIFAAGFKEYFAGPLKITEAVDYQDEYNWNVWPGAVNAGGIEGGYINVENDLNTLLTNNPTMKFYIASGLFDTVCPAAEVKYMVDHLQPAVAARIQIDHYPAGHPIYFGQISAKQFQGVMSSFLSKQAPLP
jgi:carboxypeptidase C (cathepsin A)